MLKRGFVAAFGALLLWGVSATVVDAVTFNSTVAIQGTNVVGALSKVAGSFVIDHPLDPANKLLYHFFVESPDVKNIYDGIIELDENGEAEIPLPSYFLALNKDFRYLATPIGQPMPNLHLKKEVHRRWFGLFGPIRFTITGGVAGGSVSWQITGIRHDKFIMDNPIVTEVTKDDSTPVKKGEYLTPEAYGK